MNKFRLFLVVMSAAVLSACSSVGVGFDIPVGPFSIGVVQALAACLWVSELASDPLGWALALIKAGRSPGARVLA